MSDLIFVGQFIASKAGKTGLTVTVDVDRYTISDGSRSSLVTAGSATEGRRGLYHYRLASADLSLYQHVATFITSDATVDQKEVAAIGLVIPDALVSSRAAAGEAPTEAEIIAAMDLDPPSVNVTYSAGVALGGRLAEVTDLPAAALTAQQTADAVNNLAPASTGATGSIRAKLDAIKLITDAIDTSAVTVTSTNNAGVLTFTKGVTFAATVSGLTISATWAKLYFTLKESDYDTDDLALLQLVVTNPAAALTDGLLYLDGADAASPITHADGTLTVSQAAGTVGIAITDNATVLLSKASGLVWDIKTKDAAGATVQNATGTASVTRAITQTI